jgi:hypothetical protein
MKKVMVLGLAVAISGLAGLARSEAAKTPMSIGLWGGYTTVGMADANKGLTEVQDMLVGFGVPKDDVKVTKVSGGLAVGLEGSYAVAAGLGAAGDSLAVGLRAGMLMPGTGEVLYEKGSSKVDMKLTASAIPVELGVRYAYPVNEQVSVGGGLFAGLGMVTMTEAQKNVGTPFDIDTSDDFAASVFAMDIMASAGYKVMPAVTIGLDLGYRMLTAAKVKATADVDKASVKKNDVLEHGDKTAMKIDLSGLLVGLSASYSF